MKPYDVSQLALILGILEGQCKDLQIADALGGQGMSDDETKQFGKLFKGLYSSCKDLGVDRGILQQLNALVTEHESGAADRRQSVVHAKLRTILNGIDEVLSARKFLVLSEEEAHFYNDPDVFGVSFKEKYPARAMREVFDAGNCYAASQYTATVFHCMRVAEFGLRKLAANSFLRVKLMHKNKPCPIEYADWQKVIDAIRSKIARVRRRPVGPKREADLQFFSNAADHCEYMKDIWRNELAHTRRFYNSGEALSVINRVKDFVTAIGEHRGSSPAQDSMVRLFLEIKRASEESAQLAGTTPPSANPSLPSST